MEQLVVKRSKANIFINHPWTVGIVLLILSIVLSTNVLVLKSKIESAIDSIEKVREATESLNKCLTGNLQGGQDVVVGINSKELDHNTVSVYDDNKFMLEAGSEIFLTNHLDDRFQTTIKCIVIRSMPRNGDPSKSSLFISSKAADKLGLRDDQLQRGLGVYQLKMKIKNNEQSDSKKSAIVEVK